MTKRKTFIDRPLSSLTRAAQAHANLAAGTEYRAPAPVSPASDSAPEPAAHHARNQRRNPKGKFA